jgi:hypothetical protein
VALGCRQAVVSKLDALEAHLAAIDKASSRSSGGITPSSSQRAASTPTAKRPIAATEVRRG